MKICLFGWCICIYLLDGPLTPLLLKIMILILSTVFEKVGGVLFIVVLFLVGVKVKYRVLDKSLSSSLQLVKIE